LELRGASPQVFTGHDLYPFYNVNQLGAGGTTLAGRSLRVSNQLTVTSGILNLGAGLTHYINYVVGVTTTGTGEVNFGNSQMVMTSTNADFRWIDVSGDTAGTLVFTRTAGNSNFYPDTSGIFPNIRQNAPANRTTTAQGPFRANNLILSSGTFTFSTFGDTVMNIIT
jgi:hypothetical protein